MNKLLLIFLAAAGLTWTATPAATTEPAGAPALHLVFDLSDGSRIMGIPSIDRLKVATQYADLDVQLSQVRTVELGAENHAAKLSLQNGDLLNGKLAATEIVVKTIFGPVTVPLAQVRRMRVAAGSGALPEGLVLHYTFNKDEGEKVTDESGAGNDGTLHGAVYVDEGKSGGGAMSFNGTRVAVVAKDAESLRLQDFTLMAWIKRGSTEKVSNTWPQALIVGYGGGGYNMGIDDSGAFFVGKVGVNCVMSSCKINDGTFHHLAVTRKGGKIVFYLDGVAFPGEDYDANFEFNTGLGVGARPDTFEASFLGLINDVEIFNRPLTDDEVKGVYASQK